MAELVGRRRKKYVWSIRQSRRKRKSRRKSRGKIVAYADVSLTVTEIAEKMRLSEEEIKTVLKEEGILKE